MYRPIHNLAWLVERLEKLAMELGQAFENETDLESKRVLDEAKGKVSFEHLKVSRAFRAAYNGRPYVDYNDDIVPSNDNHHYTYPTYNSIKTISRTLDSVSSQTVSVNEHIIIDGCSTDGTFELLKRYRESVP